jgi:glycosyltransferase involved in cell wall biosynthesis
MGFNLPHHLYPDSPYFTRVLDLRRRLRWRAKSKLIHHYTRGFADAWVVQTDDVNERLRRWIPSENVHTVANTISRAYAFALQEAVPESPASIGDRNEFRLLVLSSYYPHKNLEILNDVISQLRIRDIHDIRFTMTLPGTDYERAIAQENRAWVENLGPQQPEECPKLYLDADAVFLPTLLECFSANYVEAMAMRRPIVTTNLGFARTVCGHAASYFEPLDSVDALEKILELRRDGSLRQRLIDAGRQELNRFGTAAERAATYLDICQQLVDGKQ